MSIVHRVQAESPGHVLTSECAGWGAECAAPGLCRLPGVFVAPTQTLLLAALGRDCDGCDGCDGCEERAAVSSTS